MSKRIVLCADGTWDNTSNKTNVYRLYKALATSADQIAFYDDGVGADGLLLDRLLAGAFGIGLFAKVKQGYTEIAHVYEEGDDLFIFGFSRGAYTARSIAGMIAACGLPTKNFDDSMVDTAFDAYRKKDQRANLLAQLKQKYEIATPKIKMLGVWDTVGSLGIPAIFGGVSPLLYGFLDTSLNPNVLNAYHALAIDERRIEFPPTLWTSTPAPGQTVEQVWFCGVHSDVGGGEPQDASDTMALSDIPLAWMMDKACALGLAINTDLRKQYTLPLDPKYALDTLHNSWNPIWGFPRPRAIADNASIADSVAIRLQHHDSWQPKNLKIENGVLAKCYQIVSIVGNPVAVAVAGGAVT
jgi:uncharacterized protein (DUF2235 family)